MALGAEKPKNRIPRGLVPALLIVLSLVLLTLGAREGESGPVKNVRQAAMLVTTPLQQLGSVFAIPFRALGEAGSNATASQETLSALSQRNEELSALVERLEEARLENERLKALLDLVDAYKLESATARILNHSTDSWNQVITIDKGSTDGISEGMPVMSANGLLGQIETVSPFTSVVRLITDPASGVAVFLQASRAEGILTGSSEQLLILSYMSLDSKVEPGDVVITSGAGGVYPKGIVIGEVVSATHNASDVYQTVVVKPVSRVDSYEEVVVLIGRPTEVKTPSLGGSGSASSTYSGSATAGSASVSAEGDTPGATTDASAGANTDATADNAITPGQTPTTADTPANSNEPATIATGGAG